MDAVAAINTIRVRQNMWRTIQTVDILVCVDRICSAHHLCKVVDLAARAVGPLQAKVVIPFCWTRDRLFLSLLV